MKGSLFIVSAPSGAGKTTLCRRLTGDVSGVVHSVSYTTRKARPGEVDGRDYHFIDEERFMAMVRGGEFLEWAEVHGSLYGTSRTRVFETIRTGTDVILDIDTQGAEQVRQKGIDAVFIFILPPSMEVLRERLTGRGTEDEEALRRRLRRARDEIREYRFFDYVIINDEFEKALEELKSVVLSRRVHSSRVDHEWIGRTFGIGSD